MFFLFHGHFKKDTWLTYLIEDMKQAEEKYAPYRVFFQKLGTIRHDFANYVQSIQFFWMDEEAAQEGKKMKAQILAQIETLLDEIYKEMETNTLKQVNYDKCPSFHDYEKMDLILSKRWKSWFPKKKYYETLENEIPRMYVILSEMKEKLSYSLDPDERECEHMLAVLDSFKNQVGVENPVLAALVSDMFVSCDEKGIDFKCKVDMPDTFDMPVSDVYHMYDSLLSFALMQAEGFRGDEGAIRFKTASQYDLWHLHLECPPGVPKLDKVFIKNLKKHKITYKYKCVDGKTEIDLIR